MDEDALEPLSVEESALAEIYVPRLTDPSNFHALPATDAIENLLGRHVAPALRPKRDLSGEPHERSASQIIASRGWRALAVWARDLIVEVEPTRTALILEVCHQWTGKYARTDDQTKLWYLRLYALQTLRLVSLHLRELSLLFETVHAILPPSTLLPAFAQPHSSESLTALPPPVHPAIPFPILVMRARAAGAEIALGFGKRRRRAAPGAVDDEARMREMDAVRELADAARRMAIREASLQRSRRAALWRLRAQRVSITLASLLAGLNPTFPTPDAPTSPPPSDFHSSRLLLSSVFYSTNNRAQVGLARVRLAFEAGDVAGMDHAIQEMDASGPGEDEAKMAKGLRSVATGTWSTAREHFSGTSVAEKNNAAVASLYEGSDALPMLQELVESSATGATTDTVVLNLATLLELRTDHPLQAKRDSLVRAAKAGPASETMAGGCFKLE